MVPTGGDGVDRNDGGKDGVVWPEAKKTMAARALDGVG